MYFKISLQLILYNHLFWQQVPLTKTRDVLGLANIQAK